MNFYFLHICSVGEQRFPFSMYAVWRVSQRSQPDALVGKAKMLVRIVLNSQEVQSATVAPPKHYAEELMNYSACSD